MKSLLISVVVATLFMVPAQAGVSCHVINAKAVGEGTGGGNTIGKVIGGGLLNGPIIGSLQLTGFLGNNLASFVETVTFTTKHGDLTAVFEGTINLVTGEFDGTGPVTGSTGKLAGATGTLAFAGVYNFAGDTFTEDLNGEICIDLAP